ncbi:TorD/DmsD family molecular chaperone [Adlercreutzia shanghongiae]|uniref:Molecular chaperone TorD family protein n=1 Tax=Adlercreutzia shanghongiae TaxID=3111773 RepID=A0ABU6IY31_9ACTN|nr:molecular chaperone TorD family protein [Adlercreutzia sp. R22]MEC4294761.1 molecular chaperone TorD family protein [Adlercreutzia sp. R22]
MVSRNDSWSEMAQAFAFIGNSLLKPINLTESIGLSEEFWAAFPTFGNASVEKGADILQVYCRESASLDVVDAVIRCAKEQTGLFIYSGSTLFVPPWETLYRGGEREICFGQATVEMKSWLAGLNLKVKEGNHQYEDHIGIELLCLSALCERMAGPGSACVGHVTRFIGEHPGRWLSQLHDAVSLAKPKGYVDGLLWIAEGMLECALAMDEEALANMVSAA